MRLARALSALAALALLAAAGCRSDGIEVATNADPLASFPAKATLAWDDAANKLPRDPRLQELDLDPLIRPAAEAAFAARGYTLAGGASPDFLLSYELGENRWFGPDGETSYVTLSLLLREPESGRQVWMGYGRAEVQQNTPREERALRMRRAFDDMLAKFPPKSPSR